MRATSRHSWCHVAVFAREMHGQWHEKSQRLLFISSFTIRLTTESGKPRVFVRFLFFLLLCIWIICLSLTGRHIFHLKTSRNPIIIPYFMSSSPGGIRVHASSFDVTNQRKERTWKTSPVVHTLAKVIFFTEKEEERKNHHAIRGEWRTNTRRGPHQCKSHLFRPTNWET